MSPLAKLFVVVNLLLSLAFFGSSATLFATRVNWKQEALNFRKDANDKLADLKKSYEAQGTRLLALNSDKDRLNGAVNALTTEKRTLEAANSAAQSQIANGENRI